MVSIEEHESCILADASKKVTDCYHCKAEITLYKISIRFCPYCKASLPDLIALLYSTDYRAKYHFRRSLSDDNN